MRFQEIHQVQFCFDVLKLHFFNELKAFHKRRWTTQVRFGHLKLNIGHASPPSLLGDYPNPSTPSPPPPPYETSAGNNSFLQSSNPFPNHTQTPHATQTQNSDTSLHVAINLLNLNPKTVPTTAANSLASSNPILSDLDNVVNNVVTTFAKPSALVNPQTKNTTHNTRFSSTPPWLLPENSSLKWAWIESHGRFVTNGNNQHPHVENSETESDTTAIMFNLDSLNEKRPEIA